MADKRSHVVDMAKRKTQVKNWRNFQNQSHHSMTEMEDLMESLVTHSLVPEI